MTTYSNEMVEIARILGEPVESIRDMTDDVQSLTQTGIIVSVTIRRYRGFSKLKPQDMGISLSQNEISLMDIGSKRLLPRHYIRRLNSIDVTARSVVRNNGFDTIWGQFIPASRYPWVRSKLDTLAALYSVVADEIVQNYDRVVIDMIEKYRVQAEIAYRRHSLLVRDDLVESEDEYVERYLDRIRSIMPTRDEVAAKFDFQVKLAFVPLTPTLNFDNGTALDALEQRRLVAGVEQVEAMEQMNADVLAQAQQEREQLVGGFVRDMMIQLRERTFLMMKDIQESMDKNGRIHPRSIEALKNWRSLMVELNAYGDRDIETLVELVNEVTLYSNDQRSDRFGEVSQIIGDISTTVSRSLTDLGIRSIAGRRKDAIQIPDVPDIVRDNARIRLGIATAAPVLGVDELTQELDLHLNITPTTRRRRNSRSQ